jgi:protocatechuate 3,4-dioxygenase beta subunit
MPRSRSRNPKAGGSNDVSPFTLQRRGVLAGVSIGATTLILGCGKDGAMLPPPPSPSGTGGLPGSSSGGTGGTGSGGTGTGGTSAGGSAGTGGATGSGGMMLPPTPSDPPKGMPDGSAPSDALVVKDDARIEVGSPPGMVDGATMACDDTPRDQLGPYYLNGHLKREMLATAADGVLLVVTGRVLNTKCEPLAGAVVDIWAANGKGVYSENPTGWNRGIVNAGSGGEYKYVTVYPGPYQGRPRHVHLMISQPGHAKLTTQMYFKGERPDIDANAVERKMVNGVWQCEFTIVLRPSGARAELSPEQREGGKIHRRFWGGWNRRATTLV